MAPLVNALLLAASATPAAALSGLRGSNVRAEAETLQTLTMHRYRADCGKVRGTMSGSTAKVTHRAAKEKAVNTQIVPGAGMNPDAIKPFDTVLKDGFYQVACIKDMLFTYGDKFHDNEHKYNLGETLNVSIVHYDSFVVKEDREQMTHEVCFDFCRTIPQMNYFGLQNGRMCYCMPFFKAMESDSTECDAVCDGNPGTICGGKTKSTIFGMHECITTEADRKEAQQSMFDAIKDLRGNAEWARSAAEEMQLEAEVFQPMFGKAGDPVASDLFQTSKAFAGEIEAAAKDAFDIAAASKEFGDPTRAPDLRPDLVKGGAGKEKAKLTDQRAAEASIAGMEEITTEAVAKTEEMEKLGMEVAPGGYLENVENASKLYYPVMYFVDKTYKDMPSTCGGTPAAKPVRATYEGCARLCNDDIHECVGFSFFPLSGVRRPDKRMTADYVNYRKGLFPEEGACFLMSKMKTATYYTGCNVPSAFLATGQARGGPSFPPDAVKCMVKFSEFNGASLEPDPSGKCKLCLTGIKHADRCFI